jgi:hypothetical protein
MSKENAVIEYLKRSKKGITSLEAINMFGATRLSAIIFRAKERGYIIRDTFEECVDRFGNVARYKRYKIIGDIYDDKNN